MKTLVIVAALLALVSPAHAAKEKPYQPSGEDDVQDCQHTDDEKACIRQGMRDYREGLCFRARPYIADSSREKLWERGYHAQAKKKPRDMSHCYGTRGQH